MTAFWIAAAALLMVALALLLPALLRGRSAAPPASTAPAPGAPANLVILREQLALLDAELAGGAIDADQHRAARHDLERRVLDEEAVAERPAAGTGRATRTAFAVVLLLPIGAAGLYAAIGTPRAIELQATLPASDDQVSMQDVEAMVAKMAERMEAQPGDPTGWALLGRSYAAMQRFPEASRAYAKAAALSPNDAQLLADHADVLAMLQNSTLSGEPERLVLRALKVAPDNLKALALAGSAAFERRDFPMAIAHWTKARTLAPAGSEFAAGLDRSIEEARGSARRPSEGGVAAAAGAASGGSVAGGAAPAGSVTASAAPGGDLAVAGAGVTGAAGAGAAGVVAAAPSGGGALAAAAVPAAGGTLSGKVSLSPALAARVLPGDTVFVFARAADGPRMPLAILRRSVADLPFSFTLDDALAMSPALKLSNFASVVVGARVSKSGNAMPQPGDLIGQIGPVKAGSGGLTLLIESVQP